MAFNPVQVRAHVANYTKTVKALLADSAAARQVVAAAINPAQNFADPTAGLQDKDLAPFGLTAAQYQDGIAALQALQNLTNAEGPNGGPSIWQRLLADGVQ